MPEPFLSVITVSFNSVKTIGDTLQSLREQTCDDFESIVIDGGSSDGTQQKVESYRDVVGLFVSEKDRGIYDAMNKGIAQASGRYLAFLNSDDTYFPETVALVKAVAEKGSIIYGNILKERQLGNEILSRKEKPNLDLMPKTMGVFHPATFIPKALFEKYGGYDLRFHHAADYHWLLRAFMEEESFDYLDKNLAKFRLGGVSSFSCDSYKESAQIQDELKTGHHEEMLALFQKCLREAPRKKLFGKLSEWPLIGSVYRHKVKKRWS